VINWPVTPPDVILLTCTVSGLILTITGGFPSYYTDTGATQNLVFSM
jgi:hypothetical protein